MKKRLLSAALALAMVLTMLPLTAFADYDTPGAGDVVGDGTERVQYINYIDATHTSRGWYVTHVYPAVTASGSTPAKPPKSVDFLVTTGVSVGGMYYKDASGGSLTESNGVVTNTTIYNYTRNAAGELVQTSLKGQVIVIGDSQAIDIKDASSSILLDVYGGTANLTNSGGKLTSVTVNNAQYAAYGNSKGTIAGLDRLPNLTSLTLKNVICNENVTLNSKTATLAGQLHSVTLDNANLGTITLDGVGTDANKTQVGQTVDIRNKSTFGNITVTGNNSTVKLYDVPGNSSSVSMTGTGGSFDFQGGGSIGELTVTGNTTTDLTTAPANISIATGCTVDSINGSGVSSEKAAGRNTVSISGNVTNKTQLKNSAVTINGGNTGEFVMETGTVSVTGNRSTMGDVSLAHDATFTLSGTNCTIGSLKVDGTGKDSKSVTFTVPTDPSNTLGNASESVVGYTKPTISGGTWKYPVAAVNLNNITYQLKNGSLYTYYNQDQLGEAVIKQGSTSGDLTMPSSTGTQVVTFKNGALTYGVLKVKEGTQIPKLPTQMNSVSTPYWSDGNSGSLSGMYPTPASGNVTLDAGGGAVTGEVTRFTNVYAAAAGTGKTVTAKLVGNVITLSGAVDAGQTKFTLDLETDAVKDDGSGKEVPIVIRGVGVTFDPKTKTLNFDNPGSLGYTLPGGNGVMVTDNFTALKLTNGTKYTLNGSGLVQRTTSVKVVGEAGSRTNKFSPNDIEVIVNAPGYTATDTLRSIVINAVNSSDAGINWTNSPAVARAINAALASITDAQAESFRDAARRQAWTDNGTRGVAFDKSKHTTAYDSQPVWLVPYLEVTVTDYKPTTTGVLDAAITANLSLKWRIEIEPGSGIRANPAANRVNNNGVFIAKTGVALSLDSDLRPSENSGKGFQVNFSGFGAGWFMHQGNTYGYAYNGSDKAFNMMHSMNGNLGTVTINKTEPMVNRYLNNTDTPPLRLAARYESLQAAVDDTLDGQHIVVDANYTGSTTINVTGKARTITIQANGKNLVVANASGGLVESNATGSRYTVKLNRNTTVTTNATISVTAAANGSASASVTAAAPGATVSGTIRPNAGYRAGAFSATASTPTGNVSVSVSVNSANNTFSFVVPANATSVTVTPSFVLITVVSTVPYTDVSSTAWYYTGVEYCYNTVRGSARLMQGMNDANTVFSPSSGFTRAQVVQILWNMKGRPAPRNTYNRFSDISSIHYAYNAMLWAVQNGYTEGYPDGTFRPNQYVTRQEMAVFLWRAAGKPTGYNTLNLNNYNDGNQVYDWAQPAMRWAVATGVLSGQGSVAVGRYLAPRAVAYRSEVAVTVMNFDKLAVFR